MQEQIDIYFSKSLSRQVIIISCVVIISLCLLVYYFSEIQFLLLTELIIWIPIFYISIIISMYLGLKKFLFSGNKAITITQQGIYENSGVVSLGYIPWIDIVGLEQKVIYKQKTIVLYMRNELLQKYISKEQNFLKRMMMKLNYNSCGTLVCIFGNALDYDIEQLFQEMKIRWQVEKSNNNI